MPDAPAFHTTASLANDLRQLGLGPGDAVMVHAAMSRVGPMLNGPDAMIAALRAAVEPQGTVLAYTDWDGAYEDLLDENGFVLQPWRAHIPPFDPAASRAIRDHGVFAEFLRTTPGAVRSANPGASVAALGAKSDWFIADHPLDYGYGPGSPFAKLVEANGKVLMLGAPWDTMTLLHHAEHLANLPRKTIRRYEVPLKTPDGVRWHLVEEFDTSDPVVKTLEEDCFAVIVRDYLLSGPARRGTIGNAPSLLVPAPTILAFAIDWLESHAG